MKTPSIPHTDILLEATLESLQEIYSMNPENLTDEHIDRIIAENRAHRIRVEEAERTGRRPPRQIKLGPTAAPKPKIQIQGLIGRATPTIPENTDDQSSELNESLESE